MYMYVKSLLTAVKDYNYGNKYLGLRLCIHNIPVAGPSIAVGRSHPFLETCRHKQRKATAQAWATFSCYAYSSPGSKTYQFWLIFPPSAVQTTRCMRHGLLRRNVYKRLRFK